MASKWFSPMFSSASSCPSSYSPFSSSAERWPTLVAGVTAPPTPVSLANPDAGMGLLLTGLQLANPDAEVGLPLANTNAEVLDLLDLPLVRRVENVGRRAGLRLRRRPTFRMARRGRLQPHANGLYEEVMAMISRLGQALEDEHAACSALTLELERERNAIASARALKRALEEEHSAISIELERERRAAASAAEEAMALKQALEDKRATRSALTLELERERGARVGDEALVAIGECSSLQYLNVSGCHRIGDTGIIAIARGCPQLAYLDVIVLRIWVIWQWLN